MVIIISPSRQAAETYRLAACAPQILSTPWVRREVRFNGERFAIQQLLICDV